MKWYNLKQNKCPNCNKDLADKFQNEYFRCDCGFAISAKRFKEIIESQVSKQINTDRIAKHGHDFYDGDN